MTGIRDVAKQAGVSTATVSRVLNDSGNVRPAVHNRVLAAVEALEYRPNRLASSLRRNDSNLIALFLDNQKSPFATILYSAIERTLFVSGYQVLSCCTRTQAGREQKYTQAMIEIQVVGAIIRPSNSVAETNRNALRLASFGIPTVFVDLLPMRRSDSFFVCDNLAGGRIGTEYLIERGHRHIGIIANRADLDSRKERAGNLRFRGVLETATRLGTHDSLRVCEPTELKRFELGYQGAAGLLSSHPEITALFALTDTAAIGAMHAVKDLGFKVPEDVSVLGYDGIPLADVVSPPLTTIEQPIEEMGFRVAQHLIERIKDDELPPEHVTLPVRFKEGESVCAPRPVGQLLPPFRAAAGIE